MAKLPTLLKPGFICPRENMTDNEILLLKQTKGIDYLMNFFTKRIPLHKGVLPEIEPISISDKILILQSETGSGKSTAFIEALYDNFYERLHKNIAITEPRILTAKDIPYDILRRRADYRLGDNIGFQTGLVSIGNVHGIIYMTTQILVQQLKTLTAKEFMNKYFIIIIDEVHLRSTAVDMVLAFMKNLLSEHFSEPECPMLVLMSATIMDPLIYFRYFNIPKSKYKTTEHYIEIAGLSQPIEEHWSLVDVQDYVKFAIDTSICIHEDNINDFTLINGTFNVFRDILIFAPTVSVINKIIEGLTQYNNKLESVKGSYGADQISQQIKPDMHHKLNMWEDTIHEVGGKEKEKHYIIPILLNKGEYEKGGKEYLNMFSDIRNIQLLLSSGKIVTPSRRIIVATNIAETGITIPTLKYVIISGWANTIAFMPSIGMNLMGVQPISQSSTMQQKGRVGRLSPGHVYYSFTKESYNTMDDLIWPVIIREEPTQSFADIIMLQTTTEIKYTEKTTSEALLKIHEKGIIPPEAVCQKNYFDIRHADLLDYPSADALVYSIEKLHILGIIDHKYNMTFTGMLSLGFKKAKIENIKMILAGYNYGCSIMDLITIAAFLQLGQAGAHVLPRKKYIKPNIFTDDPKKTELYNKLIIQDDCIEFIFLWNAFTNMVGEQANQYKNDLDTKGEKSSSRMFIVDIQTWCINNNLNYNVLMMVGETIDELIESCLVVGVNPFANGLDLPMGSYNLKNIITNDIQAGMKEIIKIKNCIYEGYKLNMCSWNNARKKYILNHKHIPITIRSSLIKPLPAIEEIKQLNPKRIIVTDLICKMSIFSKEYGYESNGAVSILDGFLPDIDDGFLQAS